MANTITEVAPVLIAQGLMALRGMNVMPRLVNSDYQAAANEKNSVINVPIPSAISALDVTPANTPPSTADIAPTSVPIKLDQWKEAPFYLTDNDVMQALNGTIPMQASEAVKAIANAVNSYIMEKLYQDVYGFAGTPGTTPFASNTDAARDARKVLNNQLCPPGDRRIVLDMDAEGNAISLPLFQQAHQAGTDRTQVEGVIGRKIGFDWYSDQQVKSHTAGTQTGSTTVTGAHAVGVKTVNVTTAGTTGALDLKKGDIITFSGDTQTYLITEATGAVGAGTAKDLKIEPGLKVAKAGGETFTIKATHVANMAFHRDAFAFATRPLLDISHPAVIIQQATDPVSGLSLRLQITREYQRTRYAYDILFGGKVVRPELACRIAG